MRGLPTLRALRESRSLSQAQLAEKTGISEGAISRYETGERDPGLPNAKRIADALGITVDDLLQSAPAQPAPADGEQPRAEEVQQ